MIVLFGLLTIIALSIIVVRIGAIALELTGLSPEIALFSVSTSIFRCGIYHCRIRSNRYPSCTPAYHSHLNPFWKRRDYHLYCYTGFNLCRRKGKDLVIRGVTLLLGLGIIFFFVRSKYIYNIMRKLISRALEKWAKMHIIALTLFRESKISSYRPKFHNSILLSLSIFANLWDIGRNVSFN